MNIIVILVYNPFFFLQTKISEKVSFQEFKDYLYLAINSLLEDFKSKSEIMVRLNWYT